MNIMTNLALPDKPLHIKNQVIVKRYDISLDELIKANQAY